MSSGYRIKRTSFLRSVLGLTFLQTYKRSQARVPRRCFPERNEDDELPLCTDDI